MCLDPHYLLRNFYPGGVTATKVSWYITTSFKKYVDQEAAASRFVSDECKDTYWEELKKNFRWALPFTDAMVDPLWVKRAMECY